MDDKPKYISYPIALNTELLDKGYQVVTNEMIRYGVYLRAKNNREVVDLSTFDDACNYFRINYNDPASALQHAEKTHRKYKNSNVFTSISFDIIYAFAFEGKSEFEVQCFTAYSAIRSILGNKPFMKLTNEYFLARYFGFPSPKNVSPEFMKSSAYISLSKRYTLDKIKEELKLTWGLKIYARYTRGFYASFRMDYEDLVMQVELNRKSFKENSLKKQEQDTIVRVLAKIAEMQ